MTLPTPGRINRSSTTCQATSREDALAAVLLAASFGDFALWSFNSFRKMEEQYEHGPFIDTAISH